MLKSYSVAVTDSSNELIHLYEIREAARVSFGSESDAVKALDIDVGGWKELGRLANSEALLEGRHRGANPGQLRAARPDELERARHIAHEIIERYLMYLENNTNTARSS